DARGDPPGNDGASDRGERRLRLDRARDHRHGRGGRQQVGPAPMSDEVPKQTMWGGRFAKQAAELMVRINASIGFDKRLWREDIAASKAHAAMLRDRGIIPAEDAQAIIDGLDKIAAEYERDGVPEKVELEDIHMTVEHRLGELIGPAAGRLHTARSRNDQVATDFKMWVRSACEEAVDAIRDLQRALVIRAEE